MKIKILLLTILFSAFNAIYADDHIEISGMEAIQCSFEEGKDLTVEVKIQKMPEIEPVNFEKISLEKSVLNVTKKDIDNTLKDIAKKHERFQPLKKKRKSKLGDFSYEVYDTKITKTLKKNKTVGYFVLLKK